MNDTNISKYYVKYKYAISGDLLSGKETNLLEGGNLMKSDFWIRPALAGALTFSVTGTTAFAHDELGGSAEKGENLAGSELVAPLLEGSKNVGARSCGSSFERIKRRSQKLYS